MDDLVAENHREIGGNHARHVLAEVAPVRGVHGGEHIILLDGKKMDAYTRKVKEATADFRRLVFDWGLTPEEYEERMNEAQKRVDATKSDLELWKSLQDIISAHEDAECGTCKSSSCCISMFPFCKWSGSSCATLSFLTSMLYSAESLITTHGNLMLHYEFLSTCFPTQDIWVVVKDVWFPGYKDGQTMLLSEFLGAITGGVRSIRTLEDLDVLEKTMNEVAVRTLNKRYPDPSFMLPILSLVEADREHHSFHLMTVFSVMYSLIGGAGSVRASHNGALMAVTRAAAQEVHPDIISDTIVPTINGTALHLLPVEGISTSMTPSMLDLLSTIASPSFVGNMHLQRDEITRVATIDAAPSVKKLHEALVVEPNWKRTMALHFKYEESYNFLKKVDQMTLLTGLCEQGRLPDTKILCSDMWKFFFEITREQWDRTSVTWGDAQCAIMPPAVNELYHVKKRHGMNNKIFNPSVWMDTQVDAEKALRHLAHVEKVMDDMNGLFKRSVWSAVGSHLSFCGGMKVGYVNQPKERFAGLARPNEKSMTFNLAYDEDAERVAAHEIVHITQSSVRDHYDAVPRSELERSTYMKLVQARVAIGMYGLSDPVEMAAEYGTLVYFVMVIGKLPNRGDLLMFTEDVVLDIMKEYHDSVYKVSSETFRERLKVVMGDADTYDLGKAASEFTIIFALLVLIECIRSRKTHEQISVSNGVHKQPAIGTRPPVSGVHKKLLKPLAI